MGLKQDLETIRETAATILDECNAVAKLIPADTLADVPRLITEAAEVGYSEGDSAGHAVGYEYGVGDAQAAVLQNTNPVIEQYTAPADTVDELPSKIDEVHDIGEEQGKQAERQRAWNEMWDRIQLDSQGNLRNYYIQAFGGAFWDDETFQPKYNLKISYAERVFAYSHITDLQAILDKQGVKMEFDFFNGSAPAQPFLSSKVTHIGVWDCSTAHQVSYQFYGAEYLVTIDKFVLKTGVKQFNLHTSFQKCYALENIVIEGNISSTITFADCKKLSRASIESIVVSLWDAATSDNTITCAEAAVNAAFTAEEWAALVATKPNWTIELA